MWSGPFGASAAAGCVVDLNSQQMRWLLDYAAQQAGAGFGAWQRDTEHMEKAFVFGTMGCAQRSHRCPAHSVGLDRRK